MKEAEAATRIEALVEGYAELAEKATEACKTALNRLEVAQADNMALNALLAIAGGRLQQAERALEEIADAKAHHIVSGSPGPLYSAGWAGACAMLAEHARQALSSIRQTGSV